MKSKKQILYSLADWKFHKNKLGYDDLIDQQNRLILTISVMDIALDEILDSSYMENGSDQPKKMFVLSKDKIWSIYLNAKWLTPKNVREALEEFGKLVDKEFIFEPYKLPKELKGKLDKKAGEWKKEAETISPADIKKSDQFMKKLKREVSNHKKITNKISDKRLIEIITHKLKF